MSWRDSYDAIDAMRFSNAKRLLRSGKAFKEGSGPDDDAEHLTVGTMVHAMVLEGKDLRTTYVIKPPKMNFSTREGKQWRAAQSLPILDSDAAARVPLMADAIVSNVRARAYIRMCPLREHILVGTINGVRCKGLVDAIGHDDAKNPGFVEIKTLPDCRKEFFANRICHEPFHYDGQVCWYRRLLGYPEDPARVKIWSVWIAVENKPPFDVAIYIPDDRMLASGEDKVRDIFTTYHACIDARSWPGVQPSSVGIEAISPPRWRIKQMNHEYEDTY